MIKQIITIALTLGSSMIFSQDIIIKNTGEEIETKIIEIVDKTIKYKAFDSQSGPIRNIDKKDVFIIIYENGKRELITTGKLKKQTSDYKGQYFMVGLGAGNSYGGLGVRAQWRTGDIQGVAFHAGIGAIATFENNKIGASIGMKFFPYKDFYINFQTGITGKQRYHSNRYTNGINQFYSKVYNVFGASILVGSEWTWGKKIKFGVNYAIGITHNYQVEDRFSRNYSYYSSTPTLDGHYNSSSSNFSKFPTVTPAMDLGFIVKF